MKTIARIVWLGFVLAILPAVPTRAQEVAAGKPPSTAPATTFNGPKSQWHGFDRYDFLMDETTNEIEPIAANPDDGNGLRWQMKGKIRCVVVLPKERKQGTPPSPLDAVDGKPWSWQGYYFDHEPQAEIALLKRGFHLGFIQCDTDQHWEAWYKFLTETHGFCKKPAFVGMSRGGRNAFTWATKHPDQVTCLYVDNPAITHESLSKLVDLVKFDVPLLSVCGSLDPILGNHTLPLEALYQQLGGRISVMVKDGVGHHPHSLRDPAPIVEFVVTSFVPPLEWTPDFGGKNTTQNWFYSTENSYREFPSEHCYVNCRGPLFSNAYRRYEFRLDGIRGAILIIAPRHPIPGTPWVLRPDFVTPDAAIDLALLDRGFHIVVGPVPTDTDGPVLEQWNQVYEYLVSLGFSKKPVMEGLSGAAGDVFAWAVANPTNVSCLYCESPILHSNMTKAQPIDQLDVLTRAHVPLIIVQHRDLPTFREGEMAAQKYRELGGSVTIIDKTSPINSPWSADSKKAIVEQIVQASTQMSGKPTQ